MKYILIIHLLKCWQNKSENVNVGICISSQSKARLSYSILENKDSITKTLTKELTKSDGTNRFNEENLILHNQKIIKKQILVFKLVLI